MALEQPARDGERAAGHGDVLAEENDAVVVRELLGSAVAGSSAATAITGELV